MEKIIIRKLSLEDVDALRQISIQIFSDTFSTYNTEENMKLYLQEHFSIEKLSSELKDTNSEFYFALSDNRVLGYLKVNSGQSQTEIRKDNTVEIERVYVLKEFHGRGVAPVLFHRAIEIAQNKKAIYIWLGVWSNNLRAINFYRKFRFKEFDKHIFKLGKVEQTDILMKLELVYD